MNLGRRRNYNTCFKVTCSTAVFVVKVTTEVTDPTVCHSRDFVFFVQFRKLTVGVGWGIVSRLGVE